MEFREVFLRIKSFEHSHYKQIDFVLYCSLHSYNLRTNTPLIFGEKKNELVTSHEWLYRVTLAPFQILTLHANVFSSQASSDDRNKTYTQQRAHTPEDNVIR